MSSEQAKALIIKLIKSGRLTKENGQLALKIYANAIKQGKNVTIQQVLKAKNLLEEATPEPEPEPEETFEAIEDETGTVEIEEEAPKPKKKKRSKKPMAVPPKGKKKGKGKGKKSSKDVEVYQPEKKEGGGCFKKILLTLLVLILLGGGAGAWFWYIKLPQLAAEGFQYVAHLGIDSFKLTPDENAGVKKSVDRITEKIAGRELGAMEIMNATKELVEGDLLSFLGMVGCERGYIDDSELTKEEKDAGHRAFQRLYRGLSEGKDVDITSVFNSIPTEEVEKTAADGTKTTVTTLKTNVTLEELKKVLATAKAAADKAEIADEAFQLDLILIVDKFIDNVLKK